MNYESLAAVYAGAILAPTPLPYDPSGKLETKFETEHVSYLGTDGHVDVFPPDEVVAPAEEPAPEPDGEAADA